MCNIWNTGGWGVGCRYLYSAEVISIVLIICGPVRCATCPRRRGQCWPDQASVDREWCDHVLCVNISTVNTAVSSPAETEPSKYIYTALGRHLDTSSVLADVLMTWWWSSATLVKWNWTFHFQLPVNWDMKEKVGGVLEPVFPLQLIIPRMKIIIIPLWWDAAEDWGLGRRRTVSPANIQLSIAQ